MLKIGILVVTLATIFLLWWDHKKFEEDHNRVLKNLGYFLSILLLAIVGTITKPIFLLHFSYMLFLVLSWGSLVWYILKHEYHIVLHTLPIIPIAIYVLGELLFGSGKVVDLY
ncbi:MAG: hypothetical protein U9N49_02295 [Campylobacterota bacterium]|nr:hypothetical protein [Campylobacterota bacterium]